MFITPLYHGSIDHGDNCHYDNSPGIFAAVLDAPERDVAACLRSGEALRCRFLVPWLPAENPTPDELSAPCMGEWTDTEYDEDEDVTPLLREDGKLRDEDEDTVEVVMGR